VSRDFNSLIKFRIPFELVKRTELSIVDLINFTMNSMLPAQAYRRVVIKSKHRVNRFGAEASDKFSSLQVMKITFTLFQSSVDEYSMR